MASTGTFSAPREGETDAQWKKRAAANQPAAVVKQLEGDKAAEVGAGALKQMAAEGRAEKKPYIMRADNKYKSWFDWLIVVMVLWNLSFIPFDLAYQISDVYPILNTGSSIIDGFFWLDMVLTFFHAYFDDHAEEIVEQRMIASRYLGSWFWVDLISVFPFEEVLRAAVPDSAMDSPELINAFGDVSGVRAFFVSVMKIPRLLRIGKLLKKLKEVRSSGLFRLFKLLCLFFLIAHISGAFFYAIGITQPTGNVFAGIDKWPVEQGLTDVATSALTKHLTSLYWAFVTLTTVGYGDIVPSTDVEMLWTIVVILMGAAVSSAIFGNVYVVVQGLDAADVRQRALQDTVEDFANFHDVSKPLQEKIARYVAYWWQRHQGFDPREVLHVLPLHVQNEVMSCMHIKWLRRIPIFAAVEEPFLRAIVTKLRPQVCLPLDSVVEEGDVGRELFLIRKGTLKVVSNDQKSFYNVVSQGDYFGEAALITNTQEEYRNPRVIALTHVDLFVLAKRDFDRVLQYYPKYAKTFNRSAQNRMSKYDHHKKRAMGKLRGVLRMTRAMGGKAFGVAALGKVPADDTGGVGMGKAGAKNSRYGPASRRFRNAARCALSVHRLEKNLYRHKWVIRPDTWWKLKWDWLIVIFVVLISFFIPLDLGFEIIEQGAPLGIAENVGDVLFLIDTILHFLTAYFDKHGNLVTSPRAITLKYLSGTFPADMVGLIPIDYFSSASIGTPPHAVRVGAVLKLPRLLRLSRLLKKLNEVGKSHRMRIVKLMLGYVLVAHWLGCVFFMTGRLQSEGNVQTNKTPWIVEQGMCASELGDERSPFTNPANNLWYMGRELRGLEGERCRTQTDFRTRYLTSFYYGVVTLATVGYGDISPQTTVDRSVAIVALIVGAVVSAVILGNVSAIIDAMDMSDDRKRNLMENMTDFLGFNDVSEELSATVITYVEYFWTRHKGYVMGDILKSLPYNLRTTIAMELYGDLLTRCFFFDGLDTNVSYLESFIKELSVRLVPVVALPGQVIGEVGDHLQGMFFICQGSVAIHSADGEIIYSLLREGHNFGEQSLVIDPLWTYSARAHTQCDFMKLPADGFDEAIEAFPQYLPLLKTRASNRIERLKWIVEQKAAACDLNTADITRYKEELDFAKKKRHNIVSRDDQKDRLVQLITAKHQNEGDDDNLWEQSKSMQISLASTEKIATKKSMKKEDSEAPPPAPASSSSLPDPAKLASGGSSKGDDTLHASRGSLGSSGGNGLDKADDGKDGKEGASPGEGRSHRSNSTSSTVGTVATPIIEDHLHPDHEGTQREALNPLGLKAAARAMLAVQSGAKLRRGMTKVTPMAAGYQPPVATELTSNTQPMQFVAPVRTNYNPNQVQQEQQEQPEHGFDYSMGMSPEAAAQAQMVMSQQQQQGYGQGTDLLAEAEAVMLGGVGGGPGFNDYGQNGGQYGGEFEGQYPMPGQMPNPMQGGFDDIYGGGGSGPPVAPNIPGLESLQRRAQQAPAYVPAHVAEQQQGQAVSPIMSQLMAHVGGGGGVGGNNGNSGRRRLLRVASPAANKLSSQGASVGPKVSKMAKFMRAAPSIDDNAGLSGGGPSAAINNVTNMGTDNNVLPSAGVNMNAGAVRYGGDLRRAPNAPGPGAFVSLRGVLGDTNAAHMSLPQTYSGLARSQVPQSVPAPLPGLPQLPSHGRRQVPDL